MYGGALAHFSCAVQDFLNNTYHDQWIGLCMVSALARFESSGFLLVGTAEDRCVCSPVGNEEALDLTMDACWTIHN
jgi:hypothetical protein